jgi:imidazolonepropionase-like amidohydrolase
LRGLTVLPGWIDAHAHITWIFGKDGKNAGQGGISPEATYASAANAYATLLAGFTTVQKHWFIGGRDPARRELPGERCPVRAS